MAFHTNIRLFWGLQGRRTIYKNDSDFDFLNISDDRKDLGMVDYFKKSVSKKVNASLHLFLPHHIEASFYAYNIFGIDRQYDADTRNYVINSIRWAYLSQPEEKELYSTDQRTFGISLCKSF
jgi:hypothetical protein